MEIYSFKDKILSRQEFSQGFTYDLFKSVLTDKNMLTVQKYSYIVPLEYEGRMDRISEELYGDNKYVDELLKINNIINPFSIKAGDSILYIPIEELYSLYNDEEDNKEGVDILNINNAKNTRKDENRKSDVVSPIVKDKKNKQIFWNKENKTVTITNKIG
jgi:hypothetical protein